MIVKDHGKTHTRKKIITAYQLTMEAIKIARDYPELTAQQALEKAKEEALTHAIEKELEDRDLKYKLKLDKIDLWNGFITFSTAGGGPNEKRMTVDMEDNQIETSFTYNSYTHMKAIIEITEKLIVKEFER